VSDGWDNCPLVAFENQSLLGSCFGKKFPQSNGAETAKGHGGTGQESISDDTGGGGNHRNLECLGAARHWLQRPEFS